MVRALKAANARVRHSWPEMAGADATENDSGLPAREAIPMRGERHSAPADIGGGAIPETSPAAISGVATVSPLQAAGLSVRAENVLKELARELTGEDPPKGRWLPSGDLLRRLTFGHLLTARNCGPQTVDEILRWAELRGVVIQRPFHAGKSLSAMWQGLIAKFSSGEFTKAEIAEALERSARRKNTRIPLAIQNILAAILNASHE